MLAAGNSEVETAAAVGVGRSTIQYWKRQDNFLDLINKAQMALNTSRAKDVSEDRVSMQMVLEGLEELKSDETAFGVRVWAMCDKLEAKTLAILEATDPEDFDSRQLPSMMKAWVEIAKVGMTINDRITGLGALVDGFKRAG